MVMDITLIITGAMMLFLGRRLFWLFVAILGFTLGLSMAQTMLAPQPEWLFWLIGIAGGIVGILLALFIQKLAIGLGGFAAGGYTALHLAAMANYTINLPLVLIAGVAGTILLYLFFDWALIILSSTAGAVIVVNGIGPIVPIPPMAAFWLLAIIGIIVQIGLKARPGKTSSAERMGGRL